MRKFLIPTKDTTIYQTFPTNNAGLDEILEIGKVVDENVDFVSPTAYESASARAVLYFDLPTSNEIPADAKYYLNLRIANASDIQRNQELVVYKVSRSWDEGSGFFYQNVKNVNDGATWAQCTRTVSWSLAGGDILTADTSASIRLSSYPLDDIKIDVTDILAPIVSESLQNEFYGLVIQFPVSDEINKDNKGNVKVFSTQTHTVHQPTLEIAWNNQTFVTGSLLPVPPVNVKVVAENVQEKYTKGDVVKITLTVRDQYPLKTFDNTLRYRNRYYLPTSSYYSLVDTQANTTIIPFDEYSKLSCDANGSFVVLDTSPLYINRFYTLRFKFETGSLVKTIPTDVIFKII